MIRIVHAYPDLLNIYGDYANPLLLQKRLACVGHNVVIDTFSTAQDISLTGCSLLYIGAGTETNLLAALRDAESHAEEIRSFAAFGGNVLATGNAMALLGRVVKDKAGTRLPCIGLLDLETAILPGRRYAEYILSSPLAQTPVIGAVNTSLAVAGGARPMFEVEGCTEKALNAVAVSAVWRNVVATQLCGPLLARNPALLDAYAMLLAGGDVGACDEAWYRFAAEGYTGALAALRRQTGRA